MDDSNLSKLLQQLAKSDVDAKIDAVTKLQAEFKNEIDIPEPDAVIQAFKACLRISNQHLQTATLCALPSLLPLVLSHGSARPHPPADAPSTSSAGSTSVDLYGLRQVLNAFLPQGGVIDRLGDARDRPREKARETLALIGGYAFRAGGGSTLGRSRDGKTETPLQVFERFMKDSALASKVWRVREQALLALVDIRRTHHLFPIRPYLTLLVGTLEDSDANVRETARTAIVELFTGPGVTDAARADLKKELTKKGVRKTIVDGVLERILSKSMNSSTETPPAGKANGDAQPKPYIPPSLALQARKQTASAEAPPSGPASSGSRAVGSSTVASKVAGSSRVISPPPGPIPGTPIAESAADVDTVYVASARDLEVELTNMLRAFEGKETEHNWAPRDRAITRIRGMLKGDVHVRYTDTFLTHLKPMVDASLKTLASLRTTMVTNTTSLYNELAMALGPALDPAVETILLNLLKMAGFVKKITAQASQTSVTTVLTYTTPSPRVVITLLSSALQDRTPQARAHVADHLAKYLELHGARARHAIESMGLLDSLDKTLRKALADANPSARQSARVAFWAFEAVWPDRGQAILDAQDLTNRKAIEKANPNPSAQASTPNTAPVAKKSSVAAAIAASRAKAKAIAHAPPTLRHQATSTARTISPPKRSMSPSLSTGSSGSPPVSPRSRIMSGPSTRAPPPKAAPRLSHSRTSSSDSIPSTLHRPASPLAYTSNSSPRVSTIRRAMQTALPASPPAPATTITPPSPVARRSLGRTTALTHDQRTSLILPPSTDFDEDSLLTAVAIPLPDESDSDMELDESAQPLSFSTPYELHLPVSSPSPASFSPRSHTSSSARNNTLSTGSPPTAPGPVVEDALRARAEQAQSAAERLLELVEPDDAEAQPLLLQSDTVRAHAPAPATPARQKTAAVWKQAAAFQDSPQWSGPAASPSDSPWWRKRMALLNERNFLRGLDNGVVEGTLEEIVDMLDKKTADVALLKRAALFCVANPAIDPLSPLSVSNSFPANPSPFIASPALKAGSVMSGIWAQDKNFTRLFGALKRFVQPERDEETLEYALIVLWEMLEYQSQLMEGREADVFAILLHARYCGKASVLGATNVIRDALTSRLDAVYGLTTLHANLLAFAAEAPPTASSAEAKAATYAYGLIALGKFILRLPDEILEEELPRLKSTLISALSDPTSLVVREAAASAIIAAQLVLRDETHLFALLDGLPDDKKNLLTYLFDKHAARGAGAGSQVGPAVGVDRLEREMRRLDGRTATPPRPKMS
ncbi:clasp N terminal-domain-containing protein [Vararia minispora EC-137]|uniref:Clasp N terminal-domain-containing protein n=1 Tax=Vararia minispora EC-137 TaxID=1314806 RepID=A0ACB8QEQ1_9AGAM|nr:clasp N terminal-domain-containing protein [Vararia minispora EC-137]